MSSGAQDRAMREAYQALLAERANQPPSTVPVERILALVEGAGSEDERLETLNVVMKDARLLRELELLRAAVGASREVAGRPVWQGHLAKAALLVVALGVGAVWMSSRSGGPELLRQGPSRVELVSPPESVSELAPTFVWRSVPAARRYRLQVLTAEGDVVIDESVTDTTFTPREGNGLEVGVDYRWWVTANVPGGVEVRAPARPLRIRTP